MSQTLVEKKSEKQRKKLLVKLRNYLKKRKFKVVIDLAKELKVKFSDEQTAVPVLAEAYYRLKDFEYAEGYLKRALVYCTSDEQRKMNFKRLADVYNHKKDSKGEMEWLDKALEIDFSDTRLLERKGALLVKTGELQGALECFKQAIFLPISEDSKTTADRAMAHWQIMTSPIMKPLLSEVDYLKRDLSLMKNDKDRSLLYFALGNGLERLEDYQGAYNALIQANLLSSKDLVFNPEKFYARVKSIRETWIGNYSLNPLENCSFTPIFVVGLPRSGTTLTESVFDQHPAVMALGESPKITEGIKKYMSVNNAYEFEKTLLTEDKADLQKMKDLYIEGNCIPADFKGYTVDKMPGNFSNIGLLKRIFPNALFINVFKNPVDAAFSIFKQNFGRSEAHSYSYSLGSSVFFRRYYEEIMIVYKRVFADSIFDLSYEAFMDEGEPAWQRMFGFCGLEWKSIYLDFYKSKRQVNTISAAQVRQKINKKSANRTERYGEVLDPLRDLLKLSFEEIWQKYYTELLQLGEKNSTKITVKSDLNSLLKKKHKAAV